MSGSLEFVLTETAIYKPDGSILKPSGSDKIGTLPQSSPVSIQNT